MGAKLEYGIFSEALNLFWSRVLRDGDGGRSMRICLITHPDVLSEAPEQTLETQQKIIWFDRQLQQNAKRK